MIEEKLKEHRYIHKSLVIKRVGLSTVSGFIAEVGDVRCFDDPEQLQKLEGYAIMANESRKHKGRSGSARGEESV